MNVFLSKFKKILCPGLLGSFLVLYSGCSNDESDPDKQILAQIGNRTLSVEDYLQRAELTIRPNYCSGKSEADKQIILNSLIAEKLLALEGEKDSVLTQNPSFQCYLRGVKEQAMRTRLLELEVEQKIEVPEQELVSAKQLAAKKFRVAFLFDQSKDKIDAWKRAIDRLGNFDLVAEEIYGSGRVPLKEVHWGDFEEGLENAVFHDSVSVGSIIGPVQTSVGYYLIKILDLKRTLTLGQASTDALGRQVKNKLKARKWRILAANYVADMMQDKSIELDPLGFRVLVAAYKPLYSRPDSLEKLPELEKGPENLTQKLLHATRGNLDQPLLRINGEPWSILAFSEYLKVRPLMFRAKNIPESEFAAHLKLAIKDILRDKHLTEKAYEKGLHKDKYVRRVEQQWRDHLLAIGKRNRILRNLGFDGEVSKNRFEALEILRPRLNEIAGERVVKKDIERLHEIALTSIPWMTIQSGVPYPQRVPPFPIVTKEPGHKFLTNAAIIATDKYGRKIYNRRVD